MSKNFSPSPQGGLLFNGSNLNTNFKEAVCIDAFRVYDSCADKDCIENMRIYFEPDVQEQLINNASNVKMRFAEVNSVISDIEHLPFQKGFYSIDLTFLFDITVDVLTETGTTTVLGSGIFEKKVILYGSEGNVKIFSSDYVRGPDDQNPPAKNLPRALIQVANPLGLLAKICEIETEFSAARKIPDLICRRFKGRVGGDVRRVVLVTVGLFSIVQLERNVQILVPSYDFGLPEKECVASSSQPCDLFRHIEFPISEFFPPNNPDPSMLFSSAGGSNPSGGETCEERCKEKCCEEKCKEKCCEEKCKERHCCGCCAPKHEFVRCN
ncbi:MAG: hypothetical protein LBP36_02320 [Oscillospiraceae bacterium]|jgi:hypothetical protein|nr:hypothetical protein [Oscillospiraceae bacterium]